MFNTMSVHWTVVILFIFYMLHISCAFYNTKINHLDVDTMLKNERLVESYIKCLLDEGPCTKEAQELKDVIPDIAETQAAKCSESQKKMLRKAIAHVSECRPQDWSLLMQKYDPNNEYYAPLMEVLSDFERNQI